MANQLDLQEQEQLDELKAFWKQYGNLITWLLTIILLAYAGWNGWNLWKRDQATKAGALYEELDRAAEAGDAAKTAQAFEDLKQRYPGTAAAQQGALLAAKVQQDRGQSERARAILNWVADSAVETEYRTIARLRLADLLLADKKFDDALKQLDGAQAPTFAGLVADRRGDVLQAQGKRDEAKAAYESAYKALDAKVDYRRLVEAKLTALGAAPAASAASGAAP